MSAETLALSRFSRRGTVPACENRSAAPAVPSLLRPQDALGAAAFVECKRMQRSRCAFLVELDSVEEFSDTPYRHAKSTPLSYRICITSAMVIIHQFYEPFLYKKTTFFVLYPILCFFLQKIIVSTWYITQKRFLGILPGADEKTGLPPPKKGSPVLQCAENRRNSYKSYKPDAPGLFGHGHDARPAGGKRAGTKENPELFQMEKLGVSGGRGWIRTTDRRLLCGFVGEKLLFFPAVEMVGMTFFYVKIGIEPCDNIHVVEKIKRPGIPWGFCV